MLSKEINCLNHDRLCWVTITFTEIYKHLNARFEFLAAVEMLRLVFQAVMLCGFAGRPVVQRDMVPLSLGLK
jgi:hypothetical protein